jgi:hypothetical protein
MVPASSTENFRSCTWHLGARARARISVHCAAMCIVGFFYYSVYFYLYCVPGRFRWIPSNPFCLA